MNENISRFSGDGLVVFVRRVPKVDIAETFLAVGKRPVCDPALGHNVFDRQWTVKGDLLRLRAVICGVQSFEDMY